MAGFFIARASEGNISGSHVWPIPQDTHIALFSLAELVAAVQANDPDTFKRWLYGGIQDLGEPAVTELFVYNFSATPHIKNG